MLSGLVLLSLVLRGYCVKVYILFTRKNRLAAAAKAQLITGYWTDSGPPLCQHPQYPAGLSCSTVGYREPFPKPKVKNPKASKTCL
jgi:hypothetical protein